MQKQDNSSSQTTLTVDELITEKEQLEQTIYKLKHDIYHLQLQKDVLEKAAELIKKREGCRSDNADKPRKDGCD